MFSKKYFQSSILVLFAAFSCLNIFAQEGLGDFILKTKDGFLLVQNRKIVSFTIEFKGKKIEQIPSDHPNFVIDDKFLQIVTVARENFWKPKADSKLEPTAEQLLDLHKIWESDYLGESLKTKLAVTSDIVEVLPKRKALYWSFPVPKSANAPFSHYMFLTTVIGTDVVGLNSAIETAELQTAYRAYLIESMKTLKISDNPFNVKELSESLAKENPAK